MPLVKRQVLLFFLLTRFIFEVCAEIVKAFSNKSVVVISQDSFYRPLTKEEKVLANNSEYDFDHPGMQLLQFQFFCADAFDYDLLEETMKKLKQGKTVTIPIYDFKTHSRYFNIVLH